MNPILDEVSNYNGSVGKNNLTNGLTLEQILNETERRVIKQALNRVNNKKKDAAKMLGISTTTLWRKMQEHKLQI